MTALSWTEPPWLEMIAGSSQEYPFEQRLFHALCLLISVLAWLYLIFQLFIQTPLLNYGPTLVIGLVFSVGFSQSRFSERYDSVRNLSLLAVALLIIPSWFSGGGAQDPTRFMGMPFFVLYLIVFKHTPVWKYIAFWTISITACLILEGFFPGWSQGTAASVPTLLKSWVVHFFTFLVLGYMIRALMVAYEQEQQRSLALMEELRQSRDEAEEAREQALKAKQATEVALNRVEEAREQLEKANQFKEKLMFMITHDLRGPLTGLMFAAELMGKRQLSQAQLQEMGSMITLQTQTLNELLEDLLSFQYVEKGQELLNPDSFDVQEWIEQCHLAWSERAAAKKIGLRLEQELSKQHWTLDRMVLQQILDNLVSNAIKYSHPETIVTIALVEDAQRLILKVTDEGPGFSDEDQEKMYGRFQKLSARPTGGESSLGLGLSIVADLVELCDGSISCQTAAGRGTTFSVSLPESTL